MAVIQGTSENAGHRIAKNGFGTVATLDPGWYGQGIYFTSKMSYASVYAREVKDGSQVFIVSVVVPGNALPITENPHIVRPTPNPTGFLAKPCQSGYQSHYTVVDTKPGSCGLPLQDSPTATSLDELVVFEPTRTLPLFLVYAKGANGRWGQSFLFFFCDCFNA